MKALNTKAIYHKSRSRVMPKPSFARGRSWNDRDLRKFPATRTPRTRFGISSSVVPSNICELFVPESAPERSRESWLGPIEGFFEGHLGERQRLYRAVVRGYTIFLSEIMFFGIRVSFCGTPKPGRRRTHALSMSNANRDHTLRARFFFLSLSLRWYGSRGLREAHNRACGGKSHSGSDGQSLLLLSAFFVPRAPPKARLLVGLFVSAEHVRARQPDRPRPERTNRRSRTIEIPVQYSHHPGSLRRMSPISKFP